MDDVDKVPEKIEDAVKPVRGIRNARWRDVMETFGHDVSAGRGLFH